MNDEVVLIVDDETNQSHNTEQGAGGRYRIRAASSGRTGAPGRHGPSRSGSARCGDARYGRLPGALTTKENRPRVAPVIFRDCQGGGGG